MQRERPEPWLHAAVGILNRLGGSRIVELISGLDRELKAGAAERPSTSIFAGSGAEVCSIVVDAPRPETLTSAPRLANVERRWQEDEQFLRDWAQPIDLLYLDAWGVGTTGYKERHRDSYLAARHALHERSLLLLDDTDVDFCGKGELVIHAAEKDGFHIIHWGRQTLLLRESGVRACEPLAFVGLAPQGEATFDEALRLHQQGYHWQAARIYERILREEPKHACALHLLGLAAHQRGRHEDALRLIGQAISYQPLTAVFFSNYGAVLQALGRMVEALTSFSHAVSLQRNCPDALSNLANAYDLFGKPQRAEKLFKEVLDYDPKHFITLHRLGNLLVRLGKRKEAIEMLERALQLAPQDAKVLAELGNAYAAESRMSDATRIYRQTLTLNPADATTQFNLSTALAHQDLFAEAQEILTIATRLAPEKSLWKLRSLLQCPTVFRSNTEIDAFRQQLDARLDDLIADPPAAKPSELMAVGFAPPFPLSFQGRFNRPLKEKFAALAERWIKPRELTRRTGKLRIGFVVTRGHEGVFLRCMSQLIRGLNKQEFDVYVFCTLACQSAIRAGIKDSRVKYVDFQERLSHARDVIGDAKCDVLYHWEIGSDSLNYLLPCYRLAPVQCTSWGTHVTSGHSRVDYYLSSELIEAPQADAFCTEKLWRMQTLPTVQQRLPLPPKTDKGYFDLPAGRAVYLCFQTILKLHPDQDVHFAEVLRRDPEGLLVVKLGVHERPNQILRERMSRTMADVFDRVRFVPWQSREDFHRLITVADVLLDTHHFSAGTTTYDGFAFNQAFVTLPTEYNLGRYTQACYRKMGIDSLIADSPAHYGELAVRLAHDPEFRREALGTIRERSPVLFDEVAAIRQHEEFFRMAVEQGRS